MLKLAIILFGLLQAPPTGVIEGIVIRSDTRRPVAGAGIILVAADTPRMIPSPVFTDDAGKFSFPAVPVGSYRLLAAATGFTRQDLGRTLFVTAGLTLRDVAIELHPHGTVTGSVLDEAGGPAIGATVQLLRSPHSEYGRRLEPARNGTTDDRGQYRIYDVPAGRYLLFAGTPAGPLRPGTDRYNLVFYPDTESIEQARPVEIKAGVDTVMDMRVRKQNETYRVSGRVLDPTGVLPIRSVRFTVIEQGYGTSSALTFGQSLNFDPATGIFEILNLTPGNYRISAQLSSGVAPQPSAAAAIRVTNANIDNLILTLQASVSAPGRILLEDRPTAVLPNLDGMRISFWPSVTAGDAPYAMAVAPGGSFEVRGLRDGEYGMKIENVPTGFYVNGLQYEGRDILANPLSFVGPRTGTFELRLRTTVGRVAGVVTDAQSRPESGIQAFLIPAQRNRIDLYRMATTDSQGRFALTGVAPGDYQIFSWEAAEDGAQYDPDFLKQHERQGLNVRVEESSNLTLNVKIIPTL